jgi:hypothetical protein
VLLESQVKYRTALTGSVESQTYAQLVKSAVKNARKLTSAPDAFDDAPKELRDAEMQIHDMEQGLYNTRAVPADLVGTKRFARVYLDVTSLRYFEAIQVMLLTIHIDIDMVFGSIASA